MYAVTAVPRAVWNALRSSRSWIKGMERRGAAKHRPEMDGATCEDSLALISRGIAARVVGGASVPRHGAGESEPSAGRRGRAPWGAGCWRRGPISTGADQCCSAELLWAALGAVCKDFVDCLVRREMVPSVRSNLARWLLQLNWCR